MSELAEDPRLALIYQEALHGLVQQRDAVESLHNRARGPGARTSDSRARTGDSQEPGRPWRVASWGH